MLNINDNVFQSFVVQTGFSISLSLANLGFVFGVIIIAIATILRNQTYGMKQILWKLVVMAILVNFGLVIMGSIFNFADQFTTYFLRCIDPTSGGCMSAESGLTSENDFATAISGAFNPQKDFMSTNSLNSTSTNADNLNELMGAAGSDVGKMLIPIFSLLFVALSLALIVISFAVFLIMLLIRYVYIAILAVLLPFAWMFWVFPATKSNFDDWWKKFIQWTIFAPVVLFFIWLAVMTANTMNVNNTTGAQTFASYASSSNPGWAAVSSFFSNWILVIIQNFLNEAVLLGLIIGGMFAANSLSITGADVAMGALKGVGTNIGKSVKNYTINKGKQGGTKVFNKLGGRGAAQRMQRSSNPIIAAAGRGFSRAADAGGKNLIDKELEKARKENPEMIPNALNGSMPKFQQVAYIRQMADTNRLGEIETVNGQSLTDFMDGNREFLEQNGYKKLSGDVESAMGKSKGMRDAEKEAKSAKERGDTDGFERANTKLKDETKKFGDGLDSSKLDPKLAFSRGVMDEAENALEMDKPNSTNAFLEYLAEHPDRVPSIMSKTKGEERNRFIGGYDKVLGKKVSQSEEKVRSENIDDKDKIDTANREIGTKEAEIAKLKDAVVELGKAVEKSKGAVDSAQKLPMIGMTQEITKNREELKNAQEVYERTNTSFNLVNTSLSQKSDELGTKKQEKEVAERTLREKLESAAKPWKDAQNAFHSSMYYQTMTTPPPPPPAA